MTNINLFNNKCYIRLEKHEKNLYASDSILTGFTFTIS